MPQLQPVAAEAAGTATGAPGVKVATAGVVVTATADRGVTTAVVAAIVVVVPAASVPHVETKAK